MTKIDESLALLPSGFVDILPPDAKKEADSIYTLMQMFERFGYDRVKPPFLEFEDSLLAPGPGVHLSPDMFRLMDTVSHRMLGVRSDTTAQIARIASSRLKDVPHPLRLSYANEVLRTRAGQIRTTRQFVQVGCELIDNVEDLSGDIEICLLPLLGLKALGIEEITIDLTVPGCVASLLDEIEDSEVVALAEKAVDRRDRQALEALGHPQTLLLAKVMAASGSAETALEKLGSIAGLEEHVARLKGLCVGLEAALQDLGVEDVSLTVDLIEQRGFEYHKMYGFTLFGAGVHGELGRGGAYDLRFGDSASVDTARGFTLYMDTVLKFVPMPEFDKVIFVPCDVPFRDVLALQEQGWVSVRATEIGQEPPYACGYVYRDGNIHEISKA